MSYGMPDPVAWELRAGKTDRVLMKITSDPVEAYNWQCSGMESVPLYRLTDAQLQAASEVTP